MCCSTCRRPVTQGTMSVRVVKNVTLSLKRHGSVFAIETSRVLIPPADQCCGSAPETRHRCERARD